MNISLAQIASRELEGVVLTDESGHGYTDCVLISAEERDALVAAAQLLATTEDIHFRPQVRQALDALGIEHKGHTE